MKFIDLRDGRALVTCELLSDASQFKLGKYRALSVQVAGEFFGGRVIIEGSNDDENFATLNDPNGNPLIFEAPRIEQILEDCVLIRARFSGISYKANVKVSILLALVR